MRQVALISTLLFNLAMPAFGQSPQVNSATPQTAAAASNSAVAATNASPPIPWRQNVFSIPFQVNQPPGSPNSPTEVQLYLSTDQGRSWQLNKRVAPQEGKFTFRATSDGEYWFGMRTIGANGLFLDNQPLTPGLRVLVDTIAPTLELHGNRGKSGEVELHWTIADPALDARTLKLEYQSAHDSAWRPLSIGSMQPGPIPGSAVGSASFWNGQGVGVISIRAEVSDIAGNRTVTQTKIALDDAPIASTATPNQQAPNTNQLVPQFQAGVQNQLPQRNPIAAQPPVNSGLANQTLNPFQQRPAVNNNARSDLPGWQNATNPAAGLNGYGSTPAGTPLAVAGNAPQGSASNADDVFLTRPPTAQPWPADRVAQVPLEQSGPISAGGERYFAQRTPVPTDHGFGDLPPGQQNNPSQAYSPYQTISQQRETEPQVPTNSPTMLPFELPRGAKLRMINSSSFELQYDVSTVDPGSITKVELWGTHDGGKSWALFGEDLDRKSPVPVELKGEGIYGFSIVVQANNGKASPTPQPGSRPEVWIGVDMTPPTGNLLAAESGENDINIRWTSSDAYPAAKPVTLSYSASPQGPWTQITTGQASQGAYTWQPGRDVPELVFIQLQVMDEAGNLSNTVSQQNVALPHHRPQGRILNVNPVAPNGPSANRSYDRYE